MKPIKPINFSTYSTEKLIYMYYDNEYRDSGWDKQIAKGTVQELTKRKVNLNDYVNTWTKFRNYN